MRPLAEQDMIAVLERNGPSSPLEQALCLLQAGCPATPVSELTNLTPGLRDSLVLALRKMTLGDRMELFSVCRACGEKFTFPVSVHRLRAGMEPSADGREHELAIGAVLVRFRLPDSKDLLALPDSEDAATAARLLLERCLISLHDSGGELSCDDLTDELRDRIADGMAAFDPGAELTLCPACPACGLESPTVLQAGRFFWKEIRFRARLVLQEVHALAERYGWSETAILGLGPKRRRLYLEMAGI